jgi:hypothetical protein
MKCVKFNKPVEQYRIDDIASFENKIADALVEQDFGIEVKLEDTKIAQEKK